jgi:hypothetical protein
MTPTEALRATVVDLIVRTSLSAFVDRGSPDAAARDAFVSALTPRAAEIAAQIVKVPANVAHDGVREEARIAALREVNERCSLLEKEQARLRTILGAMTHESLEVAAARLRACVDRSPPPPQPSTPSTVVPWHSPPPPPPAPPPPVVELLPAVYDCYEDHEDGEIVRVAAINPVDLNPVETKTIAHPRKPHNVGRTLRFTMNTLMRWKRVADPERK